MEGAPEARPWFRGRVDDITRVLALLKANRFVTLTGGPGIGKTTLAAEAARHAMVDRDFGLARAVWLELTARYTPEMLREALALLFGVDPARCTSDLALAKALGDVHALVVLDNAEDLLRTEGEGFQSLLDNATRHVPGLRVLVTTRRALGDLDGVQERSCPVDRLPLGVDREVFVAVAGWKLDADHDSTVVDALVAALAGHPQSIVLVAGQVGRELSLGELLKRVSAEDPEVVRDAELLDDKMNETGDARLRTRRLVSSLNLSFRPLLESAPGAAEMFAWLGNFPGGLPEVLLTGVFGEDARRHLGRLLAHNMVERRGPNDRVMLSGPVRWYARAQQRATVGGREVIAEGRRRALLTRSGVVMAGWLTALAQSTGQPGAASACARARGDGDALPVLAEEFSKMLVQDRDDIGAGMGEAFYAFAHLARYGAYPKDAERIGEAMLQVLPDGGSKRGYARVNQALGDLYVRTNRLADAERAYGEALPIYRMIEDRLGEAETQLALGDLCARSHRVFEARRSYVEAQSLYLANMAHSGTVESGIGAANALLRMGSLDVRTGHLSVGQRALDKSLQIYRMFSDRIGEANARNELASMLLRTNQLSAAEQEYGRALSISSENEDHFGTANAQKGLGEVYLLTGRLSDAERAYREALSGYCEVENDLGAANVFQALGRLSIALKETRKAIEQCAMALRIQDSIDDQLGRAGTHTILSRVARSAGQFERAAVLACRAYVLAGDSYIYDAMAAVVALSEALADGRDPARHGIAVLVWALAQSIRHPLAQQYAPLLRRLGLDPDMLSPDDVILEARKALLEVSARYEQMLRDRNEDPYSPLDTTP